ncbi:MAG TPA: hypothetical protein VGC38_04995 [Pseudolabrys sp.]
MRPTRLTRKFTAGALTMALGAAVLAWPAPVRAEDDSVPIDKKIMRSILEGIGLQKDGASSGIDYQERAPLVIPQGRVLPPPEKSDAVVAKDPAWPKDQELARRKAEAERNRNRNVSEERENEQNPLRGNQLTPGGNPRAASSRSQATSGDGTTGQPGDRLSGDEIGSKGNLFSRIFGGDKPEATKFTGERPRASLTDPPTGYQTPSPDQPYGMGAPEKPKANNYKETQGLPDGAR